MKNLTYLILTLGAFLYCNLSIAQENDESQEGTQNQKSMALDATAKQLSLHLASNDSHKSNPFEKSIIGENSIHTIHREETSWL